ncbi:WXG100 family type VII secretion target [Streptomyces sp. NPDC059740]|uniref:WXG100 family type VII secretion target n=1 Tax=Streptomyces sp. NPDC059740 TaxID=3346926 RepID=UPI00364B28C4
MTVQSAASDAYAWVNKQIETLPSIQDVHDSAEHGIDAGLDDAIRWFLDKVGLMDQLEKVTGMPSQLTAAAHQWRSQGQELQRLAQALRAGARRLPDHWGGDASDRFGEGMGKIVSAVDGTAKEMGEVAHILSKAAEECKMAEDAIVEIIREAIEWAAMTLAAMVVTDILTLGLATVVDGLVAEAEVAVFLARVERVSTKLAETLRTLMKAVKEMKAGLGSAGEALKAAKALRKAGGAFGEGAFRSKDWWAHHMLSGQIAKHGSLPVIGGLTGLTGDYKDPAVQAAEHFGREALGKDQADPEPAPYRVPKGDIKDVFG